MKLWKNFSLEKKSISRQDNIKDIMSFKSTNLINHVKKNMPIKKVTFESKKSSKNSLSSSFSDDAKNPEQNQKIQDETENEKNAKTIQINLAQKKFNDMKILSSSDLFSNNKEKKLKNVYPTISNFNSQKKDNLFKIKIKKPKSQSNYNNNSILHKWTENINKLLHKSLKKTKKDIIQILKKHKIKNIKKIFKKKNELRINNSTSPTQNNLDIINSTKTRNNLDLNSNITSPLKNAYTYNSYSRPNNYISSDQYTESSISSRSMYNNYKYDYYNRNNRNYNYLNRYDKNYKRKINYKEYMKDEHILNNKWKKKLGILNREIKYGPDLLSNSNFQYNTIKDEINLISEGVHYYKISLFGKEDLLNAFNNKDLYSQIKINKTLEETCALLSMIPKIILKDYYIHCDKFISLPEPRKEYLFNKVINNETECFSDNIKLLFKIVNFIKACFEVYVQLSNQVDEEMLIAKNDFEILRIIFAKSRYYIGNLTNFVNNMLKDFYFDKNLIKKSKPILNEIKERLRDEKKSIYDYNYTIKSQKNEKKKGRKNIYYISRNYKKGNNLNKMSNNLNLQNDEYFQKLIRVKKALDNSEIKNITDDIRFKNLGLAVGKPMGLIFSPLMTKMLKYIKKDKREKIIALRSTEKFFPKDHVEKEK